MVAVESLPVQAVHKIELSDEVFIIISASYSNLIYFSGLAKRQTGEAHVFVCAGGVRLEEISLVDVHLVVHSIHKIGVRYLFQVG